MRELGIQQQKPRYPPWTQFRRVAPAVGLKRSAGFQQSHPLEIFFALHRLIKRMRETSEVRADQPRQRFGALDKPPKLDVLPSFTVRHGGVGHALKQVRPL